MGYDIIGDVHGHAARLKALLKELGYRDRDGAWRHADRTAIFVGDLIDRGPGQLETLVTVRRMVESGAALAVMGNHEFNAIGWHTPHPRKIGDYIRTRHGDKGAKNRKQHEAFLQELGEDSSAHRYWIDWLCRLPLWIEKTDFRVIHACWSPSDVRTLEPHLSQGKVLTPKVLEMGSEKGNEIHAAVETLLKGLEVKLPPGVSFRDKEGHERHEIRTRWWNPERTTFRSAYIGPPSDDMPDRPIPGYEPLPEVDRPTFIGHYWLDPKEALKPVAPRVACLDYSVAKGGPLVAYRFEGEPVLLDANFKSV